MVNFRIFSSNIFSFFKFEFPFLSMKFITASDHTNNFSKVYKIFFRWNWIKKNIQVHPTPFYLLFSILPYNGIIPCGWVYYDPPIRHRRLVPKFLEWEDFGEVVRLPWECGVSKYIPAFSLYWIKYISFLSKI